MRYSQLRVYPGSRPLAPVRSDVNPDDWHCTWVYRLVSCPAGGNGTGFWELKFINAGCPVHGNLAAAA